MVGEIQLEKHEIALAWLAVPSGPGRKAIENERTTMPMDILGNYAQIVIWRTNKCLEAKCTILSMFLL